MMRKLKTLFAAGLILGLLFLLSQAGLVVKRLPAVLPGPGEGIPFAYFEGVGSSFRGRIPPLLAEKAGTAKPLLEAAGELFSIFEEAEQLALLFTMEGIRPHFSGIFRFNKNFAAQIQPGAPLGTGLSLSGDGPDDRGFLQIKGPPPFFPMYLSPQRGLVLVGSAPEKVAAMVSALKSGKGGMEVTWDVERKWPNHLLLYDGGLLSHLAGTRGYSFDPRGLLLTAGWREDSTGGQFQWKAAGLEALLPEALASLLIPESWDKKYLAPEPLIGAFGVNFPRIPLGLLERAGGRLFKLGELAGFNLKELADISEGPIMGLLGGSSKFLFFNLPGVLFQMPGRGEKGMALVKAFWEKPWGLLMTAPEKVRDTLAGGVASLPFPALCAANDGMILAGIMDKVHLEEGKGRKIWEAVPLLRGRGEALFWAFLDGPALSEALGVLQKAGDIAGKMGRSLGFDLDGEIPALQALRSLGEISIVMQSPGEGVIQWKKFTPGKNR